MEYGVIERELHIDASPEVVYGVISSPEHLREWWPDDAELDPVVGGTGRSTFGDPTSPDAIGRPHRPGGRPAAPLRVPLGHRRRAGHRDHPKPQPQQKQQPKQPEPQQQKEQQPKQLIQAVYVSQFPFILID